MTTQLSLGDLAHALDVLKPLGSATENAVAQAVGFRLRRDEERAQRRSPGPPTPATTTAPDRPVLKRRKLARKHKEEEPARGGQWLEPERDPSVQQTLPIAISSAVLLESEEGESTASVPMEPLFESRGVRGILIASVGVRSEGDEINIELLIEKIARCEVLRDLPRRIEARAPAKLHVLVDRRDAMLPFYRDQDMIVEQLRGVVGRDQIRLHYFSASPLELFDANANADRLDFAYMASGHPVLLLSDLGIGFVPFADTSVGSRDWLTLISKAHRARCPVVAFNPYSHPYPDRRWPRHIVQAVAIVPWDRATTASGVRARVGFGLAIPT